MGKEKWKIKEKRGERGNGETERREKRQGVSQALEKGKGKRGEDGESKGRTEKEKKDGGKRIGRGKGGEEGGKMHR